MEIRKANSEDFERLVAYNEIIYPDRKHIFRTLLSFWYSQCSDEIEETWIIDDDGLIRGEVVSSYMSYYYRNEVHKSRWVFDLFVDNSLRNDTWGLDLMLAYNQQSSVFATGSNDNALKINIKIGYKLLGNIRKYVKIINPLWFATSVFRSKTRVYLFPKTICVGESNLYRLVPSSALGELGCYNSSLLEIRRTPEFMNWRLNSGLHKYAIYQRDNTNDYFIARTITRKHIDALVIVDYRCVLTTKDTIQSIVIASNIVANELHIPILIFGSSISVVDEVLEADKFKSIGRPRPILGKEKGIGGKECEDAINNRNYAFVTFLDSDGETSW